MKTKLMLIAVLLGVFFSSCSEKKIDNKKKSEQVKMENKAVTNQNVVKESVADKEGNKIDLVFDNDKDVVKINYKGESTELKSQKPASGFWYKNDHYELSGKGNDMQLKKDGKIIYEHQDEIVMVEAKCKNGDVLNLTFNNTQETLKAYLNGGKQIDMKRVKSASGIIYKNDTYELIGKGDKYKLTEKGKVVFDNWSKK